MSDKSPKNEHRFPCQTCGADYRFDPSQHRLVCDYCGDSQPIKTTDAPHIREMDYRAALAQTLPAQDIEETRVSQCPNCAAQVEFPEGHHARDCPFCATPVVTDTGAHRHIKPRGILAFSLDQSAARDAMNTWLGGLWFAPNGLKEYARKGRKMQGIYVPYWTFDADTQSQYSGERGTVYYETRQVMRDGKPQTIQTAKVRWRGVRGRVARMFDDVLVLASKSLPKRFTEALAPWNLSELDPYHPEFIAGFHAEAYGIDVEDGFRDARAQMDRAIARDVRFDIGGDRQRIHHIDTDVRNVTFKHILLPVWMAAYKYRGRTYRFVINGQTGRVQGERPYSAWKIAMAVALGAVLAAGVGYIIAMNQ